MVAQILISPSLKDRIQEIEKILQKKGFKNPHADLLYITSDTKLGIEQARQIKDHFSYKPVQSKGKIVVLESADLLTIEAQNALLKTLEELPEEAVIILGASTDANFLPTVLSRCQIVRIQNSEFRIQNSDQDIEQLLTMNLEQRFEYIEKLKDKQRFLNALTEYFHQQLIESPNKNTAEIAEELLQAEKWAAQNVNIRGILEYLMLEIP